MSFLSSLGRKIRNGFDDVGSFVTGQPAHGPSIPAPQIQQPLQQGLPQPKINLSKPNMGFSNPLAPNNTQNPFSPVKQPVQSTPQSYSAPSQPHRNIFEEGWDQVNPLDNGRTFKQATPTNQRSIVGQVTHNGLTNTAGNYIVKPVVNTVKVPVDAAKMEYDSLTGAPLQSQVNDANATKNAWDNSLVGGLVNQGINTGQFVGNLAFKAPILDTLGKSQEAENARTAGIQEFNRTAFGQVTRPLQFGIANIGHATPQAEEQVGLDPNETGAQKYIGDPVAGGVNLYLMGKGGKGAAEKGVPESADVPKSSVPDISKEDAQTIDEGMRRAAKTSPLTKDEQALQQHAQAVLKQYKNPTDTIRTKRLSELTNDKPTQFVPVNELNSYEGAPDRARVDFYKNQIKSGQQSEPLIAIRDSKGKLGIEDGKHRLQAYKELGIERAPVKVADASELKNLSSGKISAKSQPTRIAQSRTTTSTSDSGTAQELGDRAKTSAASVPKIKGIKAEAQPKPNVFVPKARLEADPELQSLYDTATKAQFLSPMEQFHAEDALSQKLGLRNAQAESAALDHLRSGGTRDEAIEVYRKNAPGVSQKMAAYRVSRAAKDANQALNPNKHAINPESSSFDGSALKAGDYKTAAQRYHAVGEIADMYRNKTVAALGKLSKNDRANFYDYVQGVKDITEADKPKAVQAAVDTFRKGADTMHALDTKWGGGKTAYIQNFFPDYWSDDPKNTELMNQKAEQEVEEEVGPKAWREMSLEERADLIAEHQGKKSFSLDTGNYSGFRNQSRIFANRQEGLQAGLLPRFTDPREDVSRYFNGAKINIAPQALMKGAREADVLEEKANRSIDLPEDKSFQVSAKAHKELGYLGRGTAKGALLKPLRAANKITGTIINQVPVIHGFNQEGNAMFAAAWRMPGNKAMNMVKIMRNQAKVSDRDIEDFYRDGNFSPKYGIGSNGFIARGMRKAGINPDKVNLGPRAMAHIEQSIRVAIWKRGKELGMKPEDITEQINHALGSPKRVGEMESAAGIFMHYLHTNLNILKDASVSAAKGHPSEAIGIAVGYAAWQAGNQILQNITGNKHASLHAPGVVGTLNQLSKAPGQIAHGEMPTIITSHTNPLINAAYDQRAGEDYNGNPLTTPKERAQDLVNTLFSPVSSGSKVADGKSTIAQQALQDFGGVNLPHVKGTMAIPNAGAGSILNTPKSTSDTNEVYDQVQQYYNALDELKNSTHGRDNTVAQNFIARDRTPDGQSIQLNQEQTADNWADLASQPGALAAVQKFYQSQANHNPEWDLNTNQLRQWAVYKSLPPGDLQKTVMMQQNSWIGDTENAVNQWASQQSFSGNSQLPQGYVQYPQIPQNVQEMMNQISSISSIPSSQRTPDQIAQLSALESNQDVQSAYNQLDDYTDAVRKQWGLPAITRTPGESPAVEQFTNQYMAADKATRSGMRTKYPDLYNQMEDSLEQQDLNSVAKYGGEMYYGGNIPDSFLSGVYGLGNYDISKETNPNGTNTYALNNFGGTLQAPGGLPTASGGGISGGSGSGSSSKDLYYGIKHAKLSRTYMKKYYVSNSKGYGKKASTKKVYTSNAKLKHINKDAGKIKVKREQA